MISLEKDAAPTVQPCRLCLESLFPEDVLPPETDDTTILQQVRCIPAPIRMRVAKYIQISLYTKLKITNRTKWRIFNTNLHLFKLKRALTFSTIAFFSVTSWMVLWKAASMSRRTSWSMSWAVGSLKGFSVTRFPCCGRSKDIWPTASLIPNCTT